ncbi:uncharacterized protein [Onthophagus taurus]|uniref:uncharacterized protein n=1 Tax=Onthophagus taurus TaxID=166361 RepID=UPI0039BE67B8
METQQQEKHKHFNFEAFKEDQEDFHYYIQRFEVELAINGIKTTDADARNLLLSKVGSQTFKLLVDHYRPDNVITKSYNEIKDVLNKYYGKKSYVLSERVTFAMCMRKETETVTQFITRLRGLAGNCEFGANLNERLRDQFVIAINNSAWQQEIIREHPNNSATLSEIEATAVKLEQASIHSQKLTSLTQQNQLEHAYRVTKQNFNKHKNEQRSERIPKSFDRKQKCLFCGNKRHENVQTCPAKDKSCSSCGKKGHFAKVCISSGKIKLRGEIHLEPSKNSKFFFP